MLGTLSSTTPCFSQVTVSHLDICGGCSRPNGTVRESTSEGEKVTDVPPQGKFWPPTPFTCPCPLDYHLICRLYWSFSTFTVLVEFGKRQVRPHEGTWCNDWKDGPNFPKVSCLANNFLLQGVEHFYKEWVCWLLPGEEERLILSYNYPLIVICLLEISDDQSYNQIFFNMIWSE